MKLENEGNSSTDRGAENFGACQLDENDEFDVVKIVGDAGASGFEIVREDLGLGWVAGPSVASEVAMGLAAADEPGRAGNGGGGIDDRGRKFGNLIFDGLD
jgi:hypothetical protein